MPSYNVYSINMEVFTLKKKVGCAGYFTFFLIFALTIAAVAHGRGVHVPVTETRLYFVDAEMLRLVPVKVSIPDVSIERKAQRVLDELVEGRDKNYKIRRIIPKIDGGLKARVDGEIVYVDISRDMALNHPEGRDLEVLTIYQIVNSLTELDGIKMVRFTIDGEVQHDFMGYIDMRETFVPDYFV